MPEPKRRCKRCTRDDFHFTTQLLKLLSETPSKELPRIAERMRAITSYHSARIRNGRKVGTREIINSCPQRAACCTNKSKHKYSVHYEQHSIRASHVLSRASTARQATRRETPSALSAVIKRWQSEGWVTIRTETHYENRQLLKLGMCTQIGFAADEVPFITAEG